MVVWGRVSDPSIPGKTLRSTLARVGTATLAPRSAVKGRVPDGCVGRVSDPFRPSKTLGALLLTWGRPPPAVHAERSSAE